MSNKNPHKKERRRKKGFSLPPEEEKRDYVNSMFNKLAPRYEFMNRIITFNMDARWRKKAIKRLGAKPSSLVLDLGCGTGQLAAGLHKADVQVAGFDFAREMLMLTPKEVNACCADILNLPIAANSSDGIICGFTLRNLTDLKSFFSEAARVLKPNAKLCLLETAQPENALLKLPHRIYFQKILPFIGGLFSEKNAYSYLYKSLSYLPPMNELKNILAEAGFEEIRLKKLWGGSVFILVARI